MSVAWLCSATPVVRLSCLLVVDENDTGEPVFSGSIDSGSVLSGNMLLRDCEAGSEVLGSGVSEILLSCICVSCS